MAAHELYYTTLFADANLQSYWRMEGNSNDAKGSKNGTDTSMSYSSTSGQFGQYGNFSGSGYIDFGNNYNFERTDSWSVVLWFNHGTSTQGAMFGKQKSASQFNGWYISKFNNPLIRVGMTGSDGTALFGDTPLGYEDSAWHQLVMTYDGSQTTAGLKCYIDGSAVTLSYTNTLAASIQTAVNLEAGARDGSNFLYTGKLDDIAIFNRVLSSTEVSNLFNGLLGSSSPSPSPSPSSSISPSPSSSASPSSSISPTPSISVSLSPSVSVSLSVSLSPSVSVSSSFSATGSPSPSLSPSSSVSPSSSISLSPSVSPSVSESASVSRSPSVSVSLSPSVSVSATPSASPSITPSVSESRSPSPSHSPSVSSSLSASPSISVSPSPGQPGKVYTREAKVSLPTTRDDLSTIYTTKEENDVYANDSLTVGLTGAASRYLMHEFKKRNDNRNDIIRVRVDLSSTLAPSSKTIYLQIWNGQTGAWETLDSNSVKGVNTELSLTGQVSDTSYYDFGNECAVRVYQQNDAVGSQTLTVNLVKITFLMKYADKYTSVPSVYQPKYPSKNSQDD